MVTKIMYLTLVITEFVSAREGSSTLAVAAGFIAFEVSPIEVTLKLMLTFESLGAAGFCAAGAWKTSDRGVSGSSVVGREMSEGGRDSCRWVMISKGDELGIDSHGLWCDKVIARKFWRSCKIGLADVCGAIPDGVSPIIIHGSSKGTMRAETYIIMWKGTTLIG